LGFGLIACRIADLGLEIEAEHALMAGGILQSLL
jgi:hypothetical protein